MKLKGVWGASLVMAAVLAIACGTEETAPLPEPTPAKLGTTRQEVNSSEKVLILGPSVNGGLNSVEARAVAAFKPGWPIDVVTSAQWRAMTPAQFMAYQVIIIGDAGCTSGTAAFQDALDTRDLWAPVIDSNIVIVGTNSSSGSKPQITRNGIEQVLMVGEQFRTSLYVSLGCAYQNAPAGTLVTLLDHFGEFRVQGNAAGCAATQGHQFAMSPGYLARFLNDSYLGLGGCAARSVFTTYPVKNFAVAAIGLNAPGNQEYLDYVIEPEPVSFFGTPYILVRGAMSVGSGCGGNSDNVPSGEECDFGDMGNGVPAPEGWPASETCSFSCRQNWCGDGEVNAEFGEECDEGVNNGRTPDASGDIVNGMCTRSCKIVNFPPIGHPPVARCADRIVSAPSNACGAPADINNGSTDDDGDLVGCTQSPAGPYNIGNTTVTLTCTDSLNNTAQCTGIVTVKDVTAPVVTIGTPNRTVECRAGGSYSDLSDVTASDLCSNPVTALTRTGSVTMGTPGTYTLTYPYKDAASPANTGSATRNVVVADTLAPTLTLNGQAVPVVECGGSYTDPGASATDQCDGNLNSSIVVTGTYDPRVVGVYPVRYSVRDRANHSVEKVRSINVRDTVKPTVTINQPTSMTVECNDPAYQDPGATATDTCVGTLPATPVTPPNTGSPGTYTVNYQATDPSGNVGTTTTPRTVTVQDTLPPTVTLNGSATMGLECADPWSDPGATARDQCAGNLPVTTTGSVNNRQLGAQTLTYSASDGFRSDSKVRTVTVSDTRAPVVTPNGPLSVTVECNDPAYSDQGATVTEACDPTPPPYVIVNPPPVGTPGSYTVNYQATDRAGNVGISATGRSVTVRDTLNPTVMLNGSAAMNLECGNAWNDPGATASDQCSGSLPVNTTGTVDNRQLSTQTLTYTATDGSGHSDAKTRAVTVRDTQAPTVTLNGPLSQRVECVAGGTYSDPGATASDACDVPPPAAVAVNPPPVGTPGSYTVNYQATDRAGNVGTSATGRSVVVEDTLPPTLALQGANPQQLECGTPWADPGATASDQCAGPLNGAIVVSGGVNHRVPAGYTVTYTVSDGQSHTLSMDRTVNVRDTLPPDIVVNGPVDQQFECGSTYVDPGASATDVCAGTVAVTATRSGSSTTPGQFTITYSAADPSGNTVTSPVVRTVHVNDNAPPTLALQGDPAPVVECATSWTDPGATANDACFGDLTASIVRTGGVDTGAPGNYPLTYNVTDPSGLSATPAQRNVRVQDTIRPVVTVNGPLNIPVECGDGTYQDPGATATDSCAGTLPAVPSTVADPNAPGTYDIGYSATDPSGNVGTSSTRRTVTVQDTLAPVLTLNPAPATLECATPWNDPGATANDQCAGDLTGLIVRTGTVNNMQPGSYTVHYSVTDPSGRSDSEDRAVTVSDTRVPNITVNGPLDDTFACGSTYVDPGATANDACAGTVAVTSTRSGSSTTPGQFTITYSATDPSGNSVTSPVTRTVHVNDDAPPTLVLRGSATETVECATSWTDQGATANDACFGDLTADIVRTGSVSIGVPGSYPLTYNVTDGAGNNAPPVTRTVNVNDTLAPSITVLGPLSQTVQCDHTPYPDPGATATDSCAGNLTSAIVRTGSVNTGAAGNYTLSYRVADPSGNQTTAAEVRTVTVVDDQAPTISLTGPANGTHECGSPYNDPGATANDACAGDLTANIVRTGAVNGSVLGAYTLNYTVTDPSNLTASTQRQVTVNDTLAPVLSLIGPATQNVECGPGYQDPGATATDACAGNMDSRIVVTGAANSTVVGDYSVTYNVSDDAGNAAPPLSRQVRVRDTVAPTITVTGPLDQQFECGDTYVDPGATATDVCAGTVAVTSTRNGSSTTPGQFTITYSAQDPSGNTVTSPVTRTVHVNDNAAPTLVLLGDAAPVVECATSWNDPGATANDACFGDLSASIVRSGNVNVGAVGSYPLIYNVTDGAGNSAASVNRTVQVRDTTLPVITVVGPTTDTYECGTTYNDPGATATDSCWGNLTVTSTRTSDPNAPANFTITYTATDGSNNTAVASAGRTVTMNDNAPPSITLNGPSSQVLECSRSTYDDPGATANDLCVGPVPVTVIGSVNMRLAGNYTLRYSAQDTAGNISSTLTRNVTITDSTPPAITLNGSNAIHLECKVDEYTELGATAEDICAGPVPVTVVESNVNTQETGAYLVRYRATDGVNPSETVRNVLVEDNLPPTISLNGASQMLLECATQFVDPGATANDICQGDVSSSVVVEFNGVDNMRETGTNPDGSPRYSYEVRYKAIDRFGHETRMSRWVAVDDSIGPVLTVTGAPTEEVECGSQPDLGVQANDACYGILPASAITASPAQLPNQPGEYDVTYSATDPAGNTTVAGATRHFTVVDTGVPEIVVNGPTELYYECTGHAIGNVWNNPGATATDTCEGELLVHQYNTGDDDQDGIPGDEDPDDFGPGPTTEVEGLYYVQYLAWDESFNIQGAILSVYVQDTLKPMLFLNGEETVQTQCFLPTDDPRDPDDQVEVDPDPYIDMGAIGDDQCYGDVTPSVMTFGEVNKQVPGVYTLEYQVRDGAFNWADPITRTVQVIDNQSPILVEQDPLVLSPPDGTMRTVDLTECVTAAWDVCEGYLSLSSRTDSLAVTSNDPNMNPNDVVILDNHTFQVRVRNNVDGASRVYTAMFNVSDTSGNVTQGECTLNVAAGFQASR